MSAPGLVRPAHARDLDRVAALFALLLEYHPGERFATRPGSEQRIRDWLAGRIAASASRVLVFQDEADLTGLCVASLRVRPAIFQETERGEIEHLVVRPEARRRGMGRALAESALDWFRDQAVMRVEIQVDSANAPGRAFWRALGFDPVMDVLERSL